MIDLNCLLRHLQMKLENDRSGFGTCLRLAGRQGLIHYNRIPVKEVVRSHSWLADVDLGALKTILCPSFNEICKCAGSISRKARKECQGGYTSREWSNLSMYKPSSQRKLHFHTMGPEYNND